MVSFYRDIMYHIGKIGNYDLKDISIVDCVHLIEQEKKSNIIKSYVQRISNLPNENPFKDRLMEILEESISDNDFTMLEEQLSSQEK